MKNSLIIFFLGVLVLSSCRRDEPPKHNFKCLPQNATSLTNAIIAYYPFSNGSLMDVSSGAHHLRMKGNVSAAADRSGNPSCCMSFPTTNGRGSVDYLYFKNPTFLNNLGQFSISFWFKPTRNCYDGRQKGSETMIKRDTTHHLTYLDPPYSCWNTGFEWAVGRAECGQTFFGRTSFTWENADPDSITKYPCGDYNLDKWVHVVATFNKVGEKSKIFINGVSHGEYAGSYTTCNAAGNQINVSYKDHGDLYIGHNYGGNIDDVIIFNKTLSQSEVNTLYASGACCETTTN